MAAKILDGAALAATMLTELRARVERLRAAGKVPGLGTILVGEDGPSQAYIAGKHADCESIGMNSIGIKLGADASIAEVLGAVDEMNTNPAVDAFIIQYPLPAGFDFEFVMSRVDPRKDADGLHPMNLGWLAMGHEAPLPCTPHGILYMLDHYGISIAGRHMVIVGRGLTIGRPLAMLAALRRPDANAAVTVVHTGIADIGPYLRSADVIVAAAGSPGIVTKDRVRPGAVVVGAGVTMDGRKVVSDVAEDVAEVASWVTPRLGGVGPMTRAMLLANTVDAAERSAAKNAG
jgi:methylenetetrahydrofolate dehydrogenase (NADP+)/methenyltetrahydrofolate cyclohydrolase